MDVLTFETRWAVNSEIIKQVTSSWSIFIQRSSIFARDLKKKGISGIGVNVYKYIKFNLLAFRETELKNLDNDRNT